MFIYKDPKTDKGNLKKSHKGCCAVTKNQDGTFSCEDKHYGMVPDEETELKTVFIDGVVNRLQTFRDIRENLHG